MGFASSITTGWRAAKTSMRILRDNKKLIIFPIISGICIMGVMATFFAALTAREDWNIDALNDYDSKALFFVFYVFTVVAGFISIFMNMALMHCARLYFEGEQITIGKGLRFAAGRAGTILSWVVFSATIGLLMRMIQDRLSWLGKIVMATAGVAWSIATFFIIPVLAYEDVGPTEALKRSAEVVTKKWGEGLSGNVSLSAVVLLSMLPLIVVSVGLSELLNERAGIYFMVAGVFLLIVVSGALKNIFVSAIYHHINGGTNDHINDNMVDGLFEQR